MAKVSVVNLRVEAAIKLDVIDTLAKFYGYQAMVPNGDGLVANPMTKAEFIKKHFFDEMRGDYLSQKKNDSPPPTDLDGDVT